MTRARKLKLNMIATLIYQTISIVSAFILPRFFLQYYGSEVNGLVSSITQFLAVISLCECGVGAVVQTALYKPIAENDEKEISQIYKSSTKFFNKIAIILIVYTAILVFVYPHIVNKSFDTLYTGILIITLSISLLAQYYFAITYKLILNAAQLIYIQMIVSTVSLVLNVVISIVLMYMGMSIQIVKLASAGIFVLQPLVYKYAVDHRFNIDRNIVLNGEPIKQKWNGLAQHLATVILENTDPAIRNAMKMLDMHEIRLTYEADLPARSGLGTSSSFAVGMLNAFYALKGKYADKKKLADEAIYLERNLCQEAGGWQDQIAASFGGFNRINFNADGYEVLPVIIAPERKKQLNKNLMMFFTGFTRFSSDVQKANAAGKTDKTEQLKEMLSLVDDAERVLTDKESDLDDFGRLLDHTWKLKRQTGSAVSTNSIDELYAKGMAAGALGGKLLGAGGGGFLVFYVQPERQDAVRWAMRDLLYIPFKFEDGGTRVIHYTPEDYTPKD